MSRKGGVVTLAVADVHVSANEEEHPAVTGDSAGEQIQPEEQALKQVCFFSFMPLRCRYILLYMYG